MVGNFYIAYNRMAATGCKKESYKANQKIIGAIAEYGWPNLTTIPTPAYLVFGSTPFEERKGRTFYDDPSYYQLDILQVPDGFIGDISRYFKIKLVEKNKKEIDYDSLKAQRFSAWYCNSFDTIIFDNAVVKMFDSYESPYAAQGIVGALLHVLKPGGKLIIDSTEPGQYGINIRLGLDKIEASKQKQKADFLKRFEETFGAYEIKTYNELIETEPAAAAVYGPLIGAGAAAGAGGVGWEVKGTHEAIVFTKPAVAGGGRRKRRSCTKKSRSKQRKTRSLRFK